ncbi:MAG: M28 family metallopeptidase [Acidobacteriota bacterium]|nr:M28 family metallopeptidase [Acidobacteriota bacterium]
MKNYFLRFGMYAAVIVLVQGCVTADNQNQATNTAQSPAADIKPALATVNSDDLIRHIKVLSSDEYEGRAPGTRGEELSVSYITEQFKRLGLKPGNPDGTYSQQVPLVGFTADARATFDAGGKTIELKSNDDYVAVTRRAAPEVKVETSDVVFVGYGVVAPEYGWDDYKDVDVRGKTIVMLINDPAIADPNDASRPDETMFKGKAMTYYGRWTYKYEIASEKGAAAAIIVHEEGPAGYPYEVVVGSWGRENVDIQTPDKNAGRVAVEAWMRLERAKELMAAGGQDFDALKKAALSKDFKPVTLNAKANFTLKNNVREFPSQNVVAKLEGSDSKLKDEYVIYTAHWDHLGRDEKLAGDQIFNGAIDNASGIATLLEIAEAMTKLPTPPKRSVLFLAVTAEEKGLLGAKHYALNPLYPLNRTLANINMDGANQWGRTKDITLVGEGNSTLDDLLREAAQQQNRTVKPDPDTEKGYFYRSDHFEFAKQGVPALYPDTGTEYIGRDEQYSRQKRDEYTTRDYHKVTDEIKPDWDLSGAVEDAQLLVMVGYRVAQGERFPEWRSGTEFKAKRDQMMNATTPSR